MALYRIFSNLDIIETIYAALKNFEKNGLKKTNKSIDKAQKIVYNSYVDFITLPLGFGA